MAKKSKLDTTNLSPDEILYINAKNAYYHGGNPIMSDEEFDALEDTLRALDSFVLDIVGSTSKRKNMLPHITQMGSLTKIKFEPNYVPYSEFLNWLKGKEYKHLTFEPKLDGNAINCIYENGTLKHVLSRGDGKEGQDYKDKLLSIPQQIKDFSGEIRGEAVIDTEIFNIKWKKEDGSDDVQKAYKNARNFVAGILGSDYIKEDKHKFDAIDFIAFEIVGHKEDTNKTLIKWGFNVHDFKLSVEKFDNEEAFVEMYQKFLKYRTKSKYQLDGIVCKTDEDARITIGRNNHHPNWALAIKFVTEKVQSKIIDIRWTLGKTGQLTPTAILEPVELMGSTVQRASVYNAKWMLDKKCYPGAVVSLIKSGDIIPTIVEIIKPSDAEYILPTSWSDKSVTMTDVHLMLDNFEDSDEFKSIKLFNQIKALGFKGIGPAMCELLHKAGMDLVSLLSETPEGISNKLITTGIFKQGRELEVLINDIFSLEKVEYWQCIYAQQYKNCGQTASKQLAKWQCKVKHSFSGLEKEVVEKYINSDVLQKEVENLVNILKNSNVQVLEPKDESGLITFEMTGDCTCFPTKGMFKFEVESSGKVKHSPLTKDTNYLVTASLASVTGKMKKAEKNGTKIVTYEQFLEIVKSL